MLLLERDGSGNSWVVFPDDVREGYSYRSATLADILNSGFKRHKRFSGTVTVEEGNFEISLDIYRDSKRTRRRGESVLTVDGKTYKGIEGYNQLLELASEKSAAAIRSEANENYRIQQSIENRDP